MHRPPACRPRLLVCLLVLAPLACGGASESPPPSSDSGGRGGASASASGGSASGGGAGQPDQRDAAAAGGEPGADAAIPPDASPAATDLGPTPSDGGPTSETGAPPDGSPTAAGCKLPERLPVEGRFLANVPRVMDFAFDRAGNLVAVEMSTKDLRSTPYQSMATTLLPAAVQTFGRGAHFLLDGNLLLIDQGALVAITPQARKSTLASISSPRRVALDAQGRPYVSTAAAILRLEPGGRLTTISKDAGTDAGALAFSPSYDTLYVAAVAGEIRKMSLGADGMAGPPQRLAMIPKERGALILDAMTVDECGNLFVVQAEHQVWRVTPAGETTKVVDVNAAFGALRFGSGRGGWKETALYVALPSGQSGGVLEVELGFRGMKDPYLAAAP